MNTKKTANDGESGYFDTPLELGEIKVVNPYTPKPKEEEILLQMSRYATDPHVVAIQAYINDMGMWSPYGRLTVNLANQGLKMAPWEASIKDWSENESLAEGALKSRFFDKAVRTDMDTKIARIMPGSLPVRTLWESIGHFGWSVTALEVVESVARDALRSNDCVALTLPSGLGVDVSVRHEGGVQFRGIWRDGAAELRELTPQEQRDVHEALQNGTASVAAGENVIFDASLNAGEPFHLVIDRYMARPRTEVHQQPRHG